MREMNRITTTERDRALSYAERARADFVASLGGFVAIPTVSAQPRYAPELRRGAAWLANRMRQAGFTDVAIWRSAGHPVVHASWMEAGNRPTLLVYGHYDVQPVDPVEAWTSPPFTPTIRGKDLFGRGSSDDKGQILAHVFALESFLRSSGRLPVNVVCLFEGEEEIGSPHLRSLLFQHRSEVRSDVAVLSDTRMLGPNRPALTCSLRGSLSAEVEVRGPKRDLHSGTYGGAVHNPIQALAELLARLHDADGRVAIPGFYRRVREVARSERARMAAEGPTDHELVRGAGVAVDWGDPRFTAFERTTIRPALTIHGITGGYQGHGNKSVIPSRASAKMGFRLVPDQDPAEISRLFRQHLTRLTPPAFRTTVRVMSGSPPTVVDPRQPAMALAAEACEQGFGSPPVFLRSGGTIPAVSVIRDVVGVAPVLMGFALPDDRMHAPNEKVNLPTLFRAVTTCIWFLHLLGEQPPRSVCTLSNISPKLHTL